VPDSHEAWMQRMPPLVCSGRVPSAIYRTGPGAPPPPTNPPTPHHRCACAVSESGDQEG